MTTSIRGTPTRQTDTAFDPANDLAATYYVAGQFEGANARTGNIESVGVPSVTEITYQNLSEDDTSAGGITLNLSRALLTGESFIVTFQAFDSGGFMTNADFNEDIVPIIDQTYTASGPTSAASVRVPITAADDEIYEPTEPTLQLKVTGVKFRPSGGNADGTDDVNVSTSGLDTQTSVGFADNDSGAEREPNSIVLTLDPASVLENAGQTNVSVTASFPAGRAVNWDSTTLNVTVAANSAQYTLANGSFSLTIPAETRSSAAGTFMITPMNDSNPEQPLNIDVTATGSVTSVGTVTETAQLRLNDDDRPFVEFVLTPTTINESGSGNSATLTARLGTAVASTTTITVSATPSNRVNLSGTTLTIPANQTSSSGSGITVTAVNNNVDAPDATVTISGTTTSTDASAPADATLTITDDEDLPTITISSPSVAEGDTNNPTLPFDVMLSHPSSQTVTVQFNTVDGSARAPGDYVAFSNGSLEFDPGETSKRPAIAINSDRFAEPDEEFILRLFSPVNAQFASGTALDGRGKIVNDDTAPTGIVLTITPTGTPTELNEGGSAVNYQVHAAFNSGSDFVENDVGVTVAVGANTDGATEGADYATVTDFTVTIPKGASSSSTAGTFTITPTQDTTSEGIETITVSGTAGSYQINTVTINLVDDDLPSVTFSLTPTTINESGSGNSATLTASLDQAVSSATVLDISASPSGAVNLSSATLTIPANQTASSNSITVRAVNNNTDAANATVTISGTKTNADVNAPAPVTLTITDDDTAGVTINAANPVVVNEGGSSAYTVRLNTQPSGNVELDLSSDNSEVTLNPATLTFTPSNWNNARTVTVNAAHDPDPNDDTANIAHTIDAANSADEYDGVTVAGVSVAVNDDETVPTTINLSVNPNSINEDGVASKVTVTASFPPGSGTLTTATDLIFTVGGTATPTDDYTVHVAGSGQLTIRIPAGATRGENVNAVTISPVNDDDSEGNETIVFSVDAPPSGFTRVTPATLTLVDDDISATIAATNPARITERTLDGARLTVDVAATQYVSSLSRGQFSLQPSTGGLSVASVDRRSNTRAVLTLAFSGDFTNALLLTVRLDGSATTSGTRLDAGLAYSISPAPTPGQVPGVNAEPGPGSLDVSWNAAPNADGYIVQWKTGGQGFDASRQLTVRGGSTTAASIDGLQGVTDYEVRVYATSNYAPNGPAPSGSSASATTLPAHTDVSTNPSPLTENNLDGATLTVDLRDNVYDPWAPRLDTAVVTASGVPGVTITDVTRISDERMVVTLAYDDTDFDADALLRVDFYLAHTGIETLSAVTPVKAVVEQPPEQVQNVRATAGTQQVHVRWDALSSSYDNPDANPYRVQWKGPGQSWRERKLRGSRTSYTIGGLRPGTEYTVRVIATRHKASDGPPSAEARATTVEYRAWLSGTEPAQLTEVNLRGAALVVDLQGSSWILQAAGRDSRGRYVVSGVPGVYVERVERLSDSRLKVILGYRGENFDTDRTLSLKINGMHTWRAEINLTTTVKAVKEGRVMNLQATPGAGKIKVSWDRIDGASAYRLEWKGPGEGWSGNRAIVTPVNGYTITRKLQTREDGSVTDGYTVRVRAFVRYKGWGQWEYATARLRTAENNRASVTVTAANPVELDESGSSATYTVVLGGKPTGNVVISTNSDNDDVSTQPTQLTFTPDNWDAAQTVSVSADHDDDAANDTAAISHTVSGADGYAGIDVASVSVTVTDDDTAGVTVSKSTLEIDEGQSATYTVVLDTRPIGSVLISAFANGVTVNPDNLTFTPDNWNTPQSITVSAPHDDDSEDATVAINHGIGADPGSGYDSVLVNFILVDIIDDDEPEAQAAQQGPGSVTISAAGLGVREGDAATYTVVLDVEPTENVVITASSDNGDVTTRPASLTFTPDNWQSAQTVTISAGQDDDTVDDTAAVSHTASGGNYDGVGVASVTVSIDDNDTAGVTVVAADPVNVAEGGTATYQLSLDAQPTGNVVITVSSDNDDVTIQPASLTFTSDNWQSAQTVTVIAGHDDDSDSDTASISHAVSGAAEYDGISATGVTVLISDDDPVTLPATQSGSVTVEPLTLNVTEGGDSVSYEVSLEVEPTANVVIAVSNNNADITTQPASLTFTTDNWQTAQTVTVSAGEDDDRADDTGTISHSASGGNYDGITVASVAVDVTDDDTDREVLRDFYHATGGANWTNSANWLSNKPLAEWHGVTVNEQDEVTALVLDGNNLTGSLPVELGKLGSLTRLALNRNAITGAIPSQLGSLPVLSIIGIARNDLSGNLPAELGNLSGLTRLSLHDNTALSGALPSGFTGLSSLQRLAIANTGICIPADEAFTNWLAGVPDKLGIEGLTACAAP